MIPFLDKLFYYSGLVICLLGSMIIILAIIMLLADLLFRMIGYHKQLVDAIWNRAKYKDYLSKIKENDNK